MASIAAKAPAIHHQITPQATHHINHADIIHNREYRVLFSSFFETSAINANNQMIAITKIHQ